MYRVLVNALSVTNQSGLHVLAGHVDRLADWLQGCCRFVVLCREDMAALKERLGPKVDWLSAPAFTAGWFRRAVWERNRLDRLAEEQRVQAYFTPSGIAASRLRKPQVVFCQNPWALEPAARRAKDAPKAWLQRRAYRQAVQRAAVMVFNSRYMQTAYRRNAGGEERRGVVVYQAADEETHARARAWRDAPRRAGQIVCVSAMAPHKNVEAVVRAFHLLRQRGGRSETCLHLVGSWPDPAYERRIRNLLASLHLGDSVRCAGFVSREELDRTYAESQVFCLMSRCESFGIPAIEAQLFGTPVVCSNVCAVPEICGEGGLFCDPDDVRGITAALHSLLDNAPEWIRRSARARANAARYTWDRCSRPLADLFQDMSTTR